MKQFAAVDKSHWHFSLPLLLPCIVATSYQAQIILKTLDN